MDIDRKTEQFEVREYEEVDQVSESKNEKKHGLLVKNRKEVVQEQNRSFRKEKEIYKECKERQGANNNRIFELKEEKRVCFQKQERINKKGKEEGELTHLFRKHKSALIASKSAPVVSTNNSALGKDLAHLSTDLNRGQIH
ncbi:36495_t:CDS:2 [Gigaspora margarita]|uniref:36495_t:CDS:1 n=1 Tax=Gigaspora margarita TaxID=4874 RepID=A0ABN7V052_GIGMA|nr:36495_t:CDS:2 [Gigaspora margarita]